MPSSARPCTGNLSKKYAIAHDRGGRRTRRSHRFGKGWLRRRRVGWVGSVSSSTIFRLAGRDERAANANLRSQGFCIKYLHRLWASYSQPCSQNLWICRDVAPVRIAGTISPSARTPTAGWYHHAPDTSQTGLISSCPLSPSPPPSRPNSTSAKAASSAMRYPSPTAMPRCVNFAASAKRIPTRHMFAGRCSPVGNQACRTTASPPAQQGARYSRYCVITTSTAFWPR